MIQYWFYEGSIPSLSLAILSPFLFIALSILYARPKKTDQR
ncbi:hypothetical protein ABE072_27045 [Bacillus paramycoides]